MATAMMTAPARVTISHLLPKSRVTRRCPTSSSPPKGRFYERAPNVAVFTSRVSGFVEEGSENRFVANVGQSFAACKAHRVVQLLLEAAHGPLAVYHHGISTDGQVPENVDAVPCAATYQDGGHACHQVEDLRQYLQSGRAAQEPAAVAADHDALDTCLHRGLRVLAAGQPKEDEGAPCDGSQLGQLFPRAWPPLLLTKGCCGRKWAQVQCESGVAAPAQLLDGRHEAAHLVVGNQWNGFRWSVGF